VRDRPKGLVLERGAMERRGNGEDFKNGSLIIAEGCFLPTGVTTNGSALKERFSDCICSKGGGVNSFKEFFQRTLNSATKASTIPGGKAGRSHKGRD
jgi:hypothetical protein